MPGTIEVRFAWLPVPPTASEAEVIRLLNRRFARLQQQLDRVEARLAALEAAP